MVGVGRRALPGQSPAARGWLDGGGLQGFPTGQGPPPLRGADFLGVQSLVPGQGSTAHRGAQSGVGRRRLVPG